MNQTMESTNQDYERIMSIVATELDVDPGSLAPEATLAASGISSLEFIEILFALEEQLGISFDTNTQGLGVSTLQDLVDEVQRLLASRGERAASA